MVTILMIGVIALIAFLCLASSMPGANRGK